MTCCMKTTQLHRMYVKQRILHGNLKQCNKADFETIKHVANSNGVFHCTIQQIQNFFYLGLLYILLVFHVPGKPK